MDLQLECVLEAAVHPDVKAALVSARAHMNSGSGGHRRGGKALVPIWEATRQRAAEVGEWQVVRLLQNSLDYAEGRILQPDFDEGYRLFQEGARNENLRKFAVKTLWNLFGFAARASREYVDEHPRAGVDDLIAHFGSLSEDARFLDAPEDRPGRYCVLRGRAELGV
ncbi:hypothetical protein [Streptomyces sp. NPDC006638]|uniref:hypothetical protein n=1 Tax=Streptomyces sp. NPDC006638 TaxID=3157183 RepID=UPI0033A31119